MRWVRLTLTLAILSAILSVFATASNASAGASDDDAFQALRASIPGADPRGAAFSLDGKLGTMPGSDGLLNPHGSPLGDAHSLAPRTMPNSVPGDARWQDGFVMTGVVGAVNTIAVDGNGNVYAGGNFTAAGSAPAYNVAKWNVATSTWETLGSGTNGAVYAVVIDQNGIVYAGGDFQVAGGALVMHVAKWDGTTWSALGSGVDLSVKTLALDGSGNLYAGGYFSEAGDIAVNYIAKWNGTSWSALGGGMNSFGYVDSLAVDASGNVYAGGDFTIAGGVPANYVAKWNGSNWSALGSGMGTNGVYSYMRVRALTVDKSGNLYAGGAFTTAGGLEVNYIAKWDGSTWSALGGMSDVVKALALDDSGNLYAGGAFATAGGVAVNGIAKWNGAGWSALGTGTGRAAALAIAPGGNVYAGGNFETAGGAIAYGIARWNGNTWSALGPANNTVDLEINAIASNGQDVYVGGYFERAGTVSANHVAKWNAATNKWSALGSGMDDAVYALALDKSGNLYAGGAFATAGGVAVNGVAKWNGTNWSALGGGTSSGVSALAVDGTGNVYVVTGSTLLIWNGSSWSTLAQVYNSPTYAPPSISSIAVDGSNNVYVGGLFLTVGSVPASYIARWSGRNWQALSSGMNGWVSHLAVDASDNLYAVGDFTTAGGVSAYRAAKWNGTGWSSLGSGPEGITALATRGNYLYAATGDILYYGGFEVYRWNGTSWSDIGSGRNGHVIALAVDDTSMVAGGSFTTAGEKVSVGFARYVFAPLTSDFFKLGDKNASIRFAAMEFSYHFDSLNTSLVKVKITSLPDHGALKLGASNVLLNQEIAVADLGNLTFTPATDWLGTTSFGWNGSDGKQYAANGASVSIIVAILKWNYFPLVGR